MCGRGWPARASICAPTPGGPRATWRHSSTRSWPPGWTSAGADVLHLGQDDLPVRVARRIIGGGPLVGRSSHSPAQAAAAAAEPDVDYFCAGPVWTTPTKPGRPATGLDLLTHVAQAGPERPWFAIGGISLPRLDEVLAAGATRVVVVRAITEADDPAAAARAFTRRLRPGPKSRPRGVIWSAGRVTMNRCGSPESNRRTCS
jgi:hypothetical protein